MLALLLSALVPLAPVERLVRAAQSRDRVALIRAAAAVPPGDLAAALAWGGVRRAAALAALPLRDDAPAFVDDLAADLLRDDDARAGAARALGALARRLPPGWPERFEVEPALEAAIASLVATALDRARAAPARVAAAQALPPACAAAAEPPPPSLATLLDDPVPEVRLAAVDAVAGFPAWRDALARVAASDADPAVAAQAAVALCEPSPRTASLLGSPEIEARVKADLRACVRRGTVDRPRK